jgi:hypothetical protein
MKRHLAAISVASAFAAAMLVPAASADPVHAKNAFTVQATCGTRTMTAVTNGNGTFTPAHVIGSTAVFVPTAVKSARVKNTITCTIPLQTFTSQQGTMTIQGSVTGFLTPR